MKLIPTYGPTAKAAAKLLHKLEQRGATKTAEVEPVAAKIMRKVRKGGDHALAKFTRKFDALPHGQPLRVTAEEMQRAWDETAPALREALQTAANNIRAFAHLQKPQDWTIEGVTGVTTGQIIRPLDAVGCYVPGGRYPLPSTLLMTTIPADVAGVPRIVVCSPKPARETLAAAHLSGVSEFYRIGGAQAIAALAYGTETIAPVNKIVGPGNLYVTAAKILASTECGIDMPAGPTEIVYTSNNGNPAGIAADLVAQAEHDPETLAIFITSNQQLAKSVLKETRRQSRDIPLAKHSLKQQGVIFVTANYEEAQTLTNRLAPEHLSVDTTADLDWVTSAGSVFIGHFAPQSMGDYISGPNHVLPTGRTGRIRGGLSVLDMLKVITIQDYTAQGLNTLGPHAIALAEAEGLTGHAESVRIRMNLPRAKTAARKTAAKKTTRKTATEKAAKR